MKMNQVIAFSKTGIQWRQFCRYCSRPTSATSYNAQTRQLQ